MTKPFPPIETLNSLLEHDENTGLFIWRERPSDMFPSLRTSKIWNTRFAGARALNTEAGNGYLYGSILGSNYSAHRVAFYMATGVEPVEVDHINGIRTDNRISNLRNVDRAENCRNAATRSSRKIGSTGVTWDSVNNKWCVRIKGIHLGRFKAYDDALKTRKAAEVAYGFHPNHGREAIT